MGTRIDGDGGTPNQRHNPKRVPYPQPYEHQILTNAPLPTNTLPVA